MIRYSFKRRKEGENIPVICYNLGITGSVFVLLGTFFPALFAVLLRLKQPVWESAAVFVDHYHVIQSLPFYFGFFLIGGNVLLLATWFAASFFRK